MVVVRDIFQLHFGRAREGVALAKEGQEIEAALGYPVARILTDVTGPYYTLVMESNFGSLADLEVALAEMSRHEAWGAWYRRFIPLVRQGRREIFRVVA